MPRLDFVYFPLICGRELEFWQRILNREAQQPTSLDDIKKIYAKDNGEAIEADNDLYGLISQLSQLKDDIKTKEEIMEDLLLDIKLAIRDSSVVLYENKEICTWKKNRESSEND